MRSTFNLDDDMLILAQQTAQRERITLGQAVSQWMRRGAQHMADAPAPLASQPRSPYSVYPARSGPPITSQDVYRLLDEEGV
ncbi:hypothetical protein CLI92_04315 [Vandammella animalimorsus]|uniref:Antitoxin n=1 Tax=Vandammella animalimorsus TaxID=2029117 RepID=A0A2A2T6T4_9BURK|nr:hypothetical protein [Vandammella animalimorsus]PAT32935.1 hypothetical protein CK626_01710 [Vandammella animalimorsus]PAX17347.1 hypothetical protein CLI92_04315 [Vandammella animalimorsus]PAX19403.1 hypothetical protein CLI93_07165 [Vandammella animalimorsus]